ncbi:MAG: hypothetical protein WBP45_13215 [Daejeonella sp.]
MVLGFKKRFEAPIKVGTKIHTIREDAKDRWRPGLLIHMATGTRSKYYNCFKETPCISYQRIVMHLDTSNEGDIAIAIGGKMLIKDEEYERLAINDGFLNFSDFKKWWLPELAQRIHNRYSGKIIHWTDFRY